MFQHPALPYRASGKAADSTLSPPFSHCRRTLSAVMSSSQHHHASSFPLSNDSFWDVPRLYKDKRYRETSRPVPALGRPPRPPVGVSESLNRATLLDYKSKSSTSVPTLKSCGPRLSPGSSVDMSTSRFSFDGSIYSQADRPESIAQNLRAKGQRLMRRQNSKFNLRTLEWVEDSDERWTRGHARRSRIQSASNSKQIASSVYSSGSANAVFQQVHVQTSPSLTISSTLRIPIRGISNR